MLDSLKLNRELDIRVPKTDLALISGRRLDLAEVPGIVFLQNLSEGYMKIFQHLVFLLRIHKSPCIIRERSYLGVLFPINLENPPA